MSRNWSIKKIKSFINNNFDSQSNNHGMVVCLDQELKILQRFTPHPTLLLGAMNKVKKRMGSSILRTREKEELRKELNRIVARSDKTNRYESFAQAQGIARSYVESVQHELFYSLKSLNAFTTHLAGIEGKKILIYISDGLPINPSEEIFSFLDQAFSFSDARNETLNYDATRIFKELTARCNANDISLYPVSAKGLESMILSADKQRGWNFHSRGSGMVKSGARAKSEGLKLLAKDTGGLAITNTNNIEKELKRVGKDLQFYYSLGYESLVGEDNKYHSIKVKLNGIKGKYNVRFKRGYKHISKKESIQEILNSRLFLKRNYNPMGIRVDVLSVKKTQYSKKLQLVLKLLIPIKNLLLYSQRGKHTGKIEVYVVLKDSKGFISSPYFLEKEVEIPKKDYKIAIKSFFPYLVEMYVEKDGKFVLRSVFDFP